MFDKLAGFRKQNIDCVLVTVVEKDGEGPVEIGKKMLVTAKGDAFGTVGGGALEYQARKICSRVLEERKSRLEKYALTEGKVFPDREVINMPCGGTVSLFYDFIGTKADVYIFGAGHVGQALYLILSTMPYHITVVDPRKEVVEAFEGKEPFLCDSFVSFIREKGIREHSFVIICTPSHKEDYHVINEIIEQKIPVNYMGMLCSKTKLKKYLESTYENFGNDIDLSSFYSPIGLDIGGGSPEEIAVSIAAEMLAVQYGKKGHLHMRGDYI